MFPSFFWALLSFPLSGDIIHISHVHSRFDPDERDVPIRSVMIGTIDLGIDRDGRNQQHHRKRTYSYTLSFHFGLLAHTEMTIGQRCTGCSLSLSRDAPG